MKKISSVSEIYKNYNTFLIDLWGVMHNGIKPNAEAVNFASRLLKENKKVVFMSNAPRPNKPVVKFLLNMGFSENLVKHVLTSGEASLIYLQTQMKDKKFFHLGAKRDVSLFENFEHNKTELEKCEYILCTGLFDEHTDNLNHYKDLLKDQIKKEMICTNPDLVVHRGPILELCAGSVAKEFEKLGGKVTYFGKPYKNIYQICVKDKAEKVLVIGDNLNTDIKGANNLNYDSVFIVNGIHKTDIKNSNDIQNLSNKLKVNVDYYLEELK